MSGHLHKLDKIAAAAAADFKSNLFNGSSSASTSTSMISTATASEAGEAGNRFFASLASSLAASSSTITASCLTSSSSATAAPRSRSNSITAQPPIFFGAKQPADAEMSSPSSSSFMNKLGLERTSMWSGFNGILRNQNLNCPPPPTSAVESPKSSGSGGLVPPKSLPLATCTSTPPPPPTSTASAVASALSSAFAPLFIEPSEVMSKLKSNMIILLDCRTWSEFNTTHIKDSVHLNCRDKITRKRLQTRKVTVKDLISCEEVKIKLDPNASAAATAAAASIADECPSTPVATVAPALQRSSSHDASGNMIVLYDDTTSELEDLQSDANPLKIVQENIKQCGYKKECKILKGGFKEFSKHWPSLCVLKEKVNAYFCDSQQQQQLQDQSQAAIENAVMNEIMPHLYLGNEMDAKDERKLDEKGIHYILNVTKNIPFYTSPSSAAKFVHKRIAVNDCVSQNLKQHFEEAIQFIDEAKRNNSKVLVHCQAGVSRSPTIVIAYLMHSMRLTMNDALGKVRQARPIVAPNLIFMSQLSDFESRCALLAKPPTSSVVDENASKCESASAQTNVNTKSMLLLAEETNDQKPAAAAETRRPSQQVKEKEAEAEERSKITAYVAEFTFDSFSSSSSSSNSSSDDAEDDETDDASCGMNDGGMSGHHRANANEVLVCN